MILISDPLFSSFSSGQETLLIEQLSRCKPLFLGDHEVSLTGMRFASEASPCSCFDLTRVVLFSRSEFKAVIFTMWESGICE